MANINDYVRTDNPNDSRAYSSREVVDAIFQAFTGGGGGGGLTPAQSEWLNETADNTLGTVSQLIAMATSNNTFYDDNLGNLVSILSTLTSILNGNTTFFNDSLANDADAEVILNSILSNQGTATNQATIITALNTLNAKVNTFGAKSSANSTPVVMATDQSLGLNLTSATGTGVSFKLISSASTNSTVVKASNARMGAIVASNNGASPAYVKLYNKSTAPVVGTDVPVFTFMIPSGASLSFPSTYAIFFSSGLGLAITNLIADTDTTAVALNQVSVNIHYL